MSFLGIDLSASSRRDSVCALLDNGAKLAHLDRFRTFDELWGILKVYQPSLIAIDAPLSLPLGLDCLEESHACSPSLATKGRSSEQELAQMHIGCFFTTKRSITKTLIYRGMELHRDLVQKAYQVIEVYPYATKVVLFGDKMPPKNTARGLAFLKERLPQVIDGLDWCTLDVNHDGCDALLAAYTACLHDENRTDLLGIPEEGQIVVPKLLSGRLRSTSAPRT